MAAASPDMDVDAYMEGSQEWDFYEKFWPANQPPPPTSDTSTAAPATTPSSAAERDAKTARLAVSKGSGGGKGHAADSAPAGASQDGTREGGAPPRRSPNSQRQRQRHDMRSDASDRGHWGRHGGRDWHTGWGSTGYGGGGGDSGGGDGLARDVRDLRYAMGLVQRLVLRLEDTSVLARIESSFVFNLKTNVPSSVVPMLFTAAGAWRKIKDEEPQKLDRPMRCSLLVCLFAELRTRMLAVVEQEEQMKEMETMGWVARGPPVVWHFVKWDHEAQRQLVDTGRPPLSQSEVLDLVKTILTLIPHRFALARFHPTRKLTQTMQGSNLVFLLQTGQHGPSAGELRENLRKLCHCSVMHLLAASLKEDRQNRSALANAVAACIAG